MDTADHYSEKAAFVEAVREVVRLFEGRVVQPREVARRHFRFEEDSYYIETRTHLAFHSATAEIFDKELVQFEVEHPALNRCIASLAPYFDRAHVDLRDETSGRDFGYWQARLRLRHWMEQCFAIAESLSPSIEIAESVFDERFSLLQNSKESKIGTFIVPIHGVSWACADSAIPISDEISLVKLCDALKSEGWYDHWFDFVSTNPRDIAYCEVAAVGNSKGARDELDLLLDSMRLVGLREIKAPDCFWLGHKFSISPAGLGPVEGYDSISRPVFQKRVLTEDLVGLIRTSVAKLKRIERARNNGALETPIRRYVVACNRREETDRLMDLALSVETLLGSNNAWLQAVAVLAPYLDELEARSVEETLIRLSKARNKIAHTGRFEQDNPADPLFRSASVVVADLLFAVVDQMAESSLSAGQVIKSRLDDLVRKGLSSATGRKSRWWLVESSEKGGGGN